MADNKRLSVRHVDLGTHLERIASELSPTNITVAMMLDPKKYGLSECPHCNGYGSSLKESSPRCTRCCGSGLVAVSALTTITLRFPKGDRQVPIKKVVEHHGIKCAACIFAQVTKAEASTGVKIEGATEVTA